MIITLYVVNNCLPCDLAKASAIKISEKLSAKLNIVPIEESVYIYAPTIVVNENGEERVQYGYSDYGDFEDFILNRFVE